MRNLKKLLAFVVAIAIVLTFSLPIIAATTKTDAQIAETLKVIKGDGSGVTAVYLAKASTRLQAAIIALRLSGKEAEALAYEGTDNFSDAADVDWAGGRAIMAYLKANPGLGWIGNGDGTFSPNDPLTAQMFYKVMLETLGYKQGVDFEWDETLGFAKALGLKKAAAVDEFINADIATVIVETLNTKVKGTDTTLIAKLVTDGIVTKADAIASGLVAPDPAFAVVSAEGTNLKEIVVKFNYELDAATVVKANFTVGGVAAAAVALSADKKSVTVTVPTVDQAAPTDYALVVKTAVKNTAGAVLAADYTKTVRVVDATIPTVQTVTLTGPTTFSVVFSEPIDPAVGGTILVNNGMYGASVGALDGSNTVNVTLGAPLTDGNYAVKVSLFKDYAGFPIDATEKNLAYVKDTSAVTASISGTPTQTSVVVKFNKAIATTLTATHFYHTFAAYKPDAVTASADKKSYTLTFTTNPIPQGAANLVVKAVNDVVDGSVKITDAWGNSLAANVTLSVTVGADTAAPTAAIKTVVSETQFKVEYSEEVDGVKATTAANYVVKNAAGTAVTVSGVALDTGNVYIVTLNGGIAIPGGAYTVTISNVTDKALTANTIVPVALGFNITDVTAPTVSSATYVETSAAGTVEYIYVAFSEPMAVAGAGSVLDLNNFRLNGAVLPTGTTIATFGGANKIQITLPHGTIVTGTLTVGQLADAAGNKIVALSTPVTLVEEAVPTITAIKTKSYGTSGIGSTIEITVNKVLTSVVADGFTISGAVYSTALVSYTVANNVTTIVATLRSEVALAGPDALPSDVRVVLEKIKSDTGRYVAAGTWGGTITDGIAPSVSNAVYTGGKVFTVTYNEAMADGDTSFIATDFNVTYDGKLLVPGTDYAYAKVDATHATITLTAAVASGKVCKIETKATTNYLKDVAGNKVNGGYTKTITIP